MQAVFAGFGLGLSLIVAIGAQNAFVLRQGILRQHVLPVVLLCAASDALLIAAGVSGFGALATHAPWFEAAMRYGGAAFLFYYGTRAFRSALQGGAAMEEADKPADRLWVAVTTCLLLTWANPHVYLDTVVLLGSISAQYDDRLGFGIGAAVASFSFFFALGYGARLLAPIFARPSAWQVLDGLIGCVMWGIALSLIA